jgi:hypothetical protein
MNVSTEFMSKYIIASTQIIDKLIHDNEYQKAFNMLLTVLNILDDSNKNKMIQYYNNHCVRNIK